MNTINGLHHLAVSTGDMKKQIAFFTDAMGMELVALYWMHGARGAFHAFLRMTDDSHVALVYFPEHADMTSQIGYTHPGNPAGTSAPGTMQHLALKVADMDEMLAMRDRLRRRGIPVIGPIDHGMCHSMYFAGPENLSLEIACGDEPINAKAWIDPEVVELCGISAAELAVFTRPSSKTNDSERRRSRNSSPSSAPVSASRRIFVLFSRSRWVSKGRKGASLMATSI